MKKIEMIVPCYNEELCIEPLYEEINRVMQKLTNYEVAVLFVDDGSHDKTMEKIKGLTQKKTEIRYLSFSRNFGTEAAIFAGLANSTGDIVVLMDADLQHPPALIPQMIKEVEAGEWYLLNENTFATEIKEHQEIVEVEITNESEKPSVDIEKTGIIQTTTNQEIKYDFYIKNTGNTALDDFIWTDTLPTDYVTATKLITGTYNQDLNYSVYYKTNKNDYRLLKENLNTQVNNYIDFLGIELIHQNL